MSSCPKSGPLVVPYCWSLAPPCGRNLQRAVPPPSHCVLLSGSSDIPRGVLQKDLGESSFQGSHHPPRLVSAEKFASEISSPLLLEVRKRAQNLGYEGPCREESNAIHNGPHAKKKGKGVYISKDGLMLA